MRWPNMGILPSQKLVLDIDMKISRDNLKKPVKEFGGSLSLMEIDGKTSEDVLFSVGFNSTKVVKDKTTIVKTQQSIFEKLSLKMRQI